MKKLVFLFTFMLTFTLVYSQPMNVTSAYSYSQKGYIDKAKKCIDEATIHEQTKDWAKTWFYRGNVYLQIAMSDNPKYMNLDSNALEISYNSYQKALTLDTKKEFSDDMKMTMFVCGEQYYNKGVKYFNEKKYPEAMRSFDKTANINYSYGKVDTVSLFNAGLAAELCKDIPKVKEYYKKLVDNRYHNPTPYVTLSSILLSEKDTTGAMKVIQKAKSAMPGNLEIIIAETNIFLSQGKTKEAQENLKIAVSKDPKNPNLYFAIGTNFDQIANDTSKKEEDILAAVTEAENNYNKAIELKPDYFDAIYNLGALYFNQGVRITDKIKNIQDNNIYAKGKEQADAYFNKALPFLEKARTLLPEDLSTLISLKQLYARTGQQDKYKEVDEKIKSLKKK
ncbi:MAG: tetratricopeptide repeat protein [Bacteroidota bacterium]